MLYRPAPTGGAFPTFSSVRGWMIQMSTYQRGIQKLLNDLAFPQIVVYDHKQTWQGHTLKGFLAVAPDLGYRKLWFTQDRQWKSVEHPLPEGDVVFTQRTGVTDTTLMYAVGVAMIGEVLEVLDHWHIHTEEEEIWVGAQINSCMIFLTKSLRQSLSGPYAHEAFAVADRLLMQRSARVAPPAGRSAAAAPPPTVAERNISAVFRLLQVVANDPRASQYAVHPLVSRNTGAPTGASIQLTPSTSLRLIWDAGDANWHAVLRDDTDERVHWYQPMDGDVSIAGAVAYTLVSGLSLMLSVWDDRQETDEIDLSLESLFPGTSPAAAGAKLRDLIVTLRLAALRTADAGDAAVTQIIDIPQPAIGANGVVLPQPLMDVVDAGFAID